MTSNDETNDFADRPPELPLQAQVVDPVEDPEEATEAAEDGSTFIVLDTFLRDNQEFDLANEGLEFVKFVRIANSGSATLSIDAIEVL